MFPQPTIEHLNSKLQNLPARDSRRILLNIELSDLSRLTWQEQEARKYAQQAVEQAQILQQPLWMAKAFNAYGNVLVQDKDYLRAEETYQKALQHFKAEEQAQLYANILVNLAQLWVDIKNNGGEDQKQYFYQKDENSAVQQVMLRLHAAVEATRKLPICEEKAANLVHLSQIAQEVQESFSAAAKSVLMPLRYGILEEVQQFEASQFPRAVSYAKGTLGALYQGEQRFTEALSLTRGSPYKPVEVLKSNGLSQAKVKVS